MGFNSQSVRKFVTARMFLAPAAAKLAKSRFMTPKRRAAYVEKKHQQDMAILSTTRIGNPS